MVAEPWPLQRMSDYQEWVENTAHNLNQAAKARAKSRKLIQVWRGKGKKLDGMDGRDIQRMLSHAKEMARQLRVAANAVDAAVKESMRHWTEWRDAVGAQVDWIVKGKLPQIAFHFAAIGKRAGVAGGGCGCGRNPVIFALGQQSTAGGTCAIRTTRTPARHRTLQRQGPACTPSGVEPSEERHNWNGTAFG